MFARKYKGVFHMLLRIWSFMYAPIASRLESLRPPPPCHLHSKYFSYAATYWSLSRLSRLISWSALQQESRKPLGSGRQSTFFFFDAFPLLEQTWIMNLTHQQWMQPGYPVFFCAQLSFFVRVVSYFRLLGGTTWTNQLLLLSKARNQDFG